MKHRHHPRRWSALAFALLPVAAIGLAACGDDDDEATAPAETAAAATTAAASATTGAAGDEDTDAFCSASLKLAQVSGSAPPPEEGDVEGGKALASAILPVGEQLLASAPASVKGDLEAMVGITREAAASGDVSGFESPDFAAMDAKVHAAGLEQCGWARQDVELMEYMFMGVPATMDAGATSFEVKNAGKEFHEMVLFKKNDGVTESFEELLALPEEEAFSKVTPAGGTFAPQGQPAYVLADLTPGEYVAICFIPVGTVDMATFSEQAPPHFTQGMIHPFTVA